jgi:hypothetical protein
LNGLRKETGDPNYGWFWSSGVYAKTGPLSDIRNEPRAREFPVQIFATYAREPDVHRGDGSIMIVVMAAALMMMR